MKLRNLFLIIFLFPLLIFSKGEWRKRREKRTLNSQTKEAKIYDCFTFFNELELLEIRLHELYNVVDKFVIVESTQTFSGKPKPLYYYNNKALFHEFEDKIIHVMLPKQNGDMISWDREKWQRNQIMRALQDCKPNDIIMVSDVDEIIRASTIENIKALIKENPHRPLTLTQPLYKVTFNRLADPGWRGTVAISYEYLKKTTPNGLRNNERIHGHIIPNAGWHFNTAGSHTMYVKKLESFSHTECDTPEFKAYDTYISHKLSFPWIPIDDSYPQFIIDCFDEFKEAGFIEDKP